VIVKRLAIAFWLALWPLGLAQSADPAPAPENGALGIFEQRLLPILQAKRPSSCTECHLSGVELKNYLHPDQATTFASLVKAGLIDVKRPDKSKILAFIQRKSDQPNLITDKVRQQEYEAFRAWIHAAVTEPQLLAGKSNEELGSTLPVEVIRHARKDRVLTSFIENIWSEVARCTGCHSPDQNQKQVKEFGKQVSWITHGNPRATMEYLLDAGLIDTDLPDESILLLKPTMQVEHGGGQKMMIGDRSYRQFLRFIQDYAATVTGKYQTTDALPALADEVSVATSMKNGMWFKLTDVPAELDKKLLRVDLFRRDGDGWSKSRWATADRAVAGKSQIWQQTLSLTAMRGSKRAEEINRDDRLPAGEYLVKVYVDATGKLAKDDQSELGAEDLRGAVVLSSSWGRGYGNMTVARFPKP